MSHRTRERRRRSHTDSGQQALLALAARRSTAPAVDPDDELTTFVISTGPAVTYRIPDPPADRAPGGRHRAEPAPLLSAPPLGLGAPDTRELRYDDILRGPDPEWSRPDATADRERAYRDAEAAYRELSPAALNRAAGVAEHVVHHQLPHGFQLRAVSPLSALDTDQRIAYMDSAAAEFTRDLDRLMDAIRAVGLEETGEHALTMLFAPVVDLLTAVAFPVGVAAMVLAWGLEADERAAEAARVGDRDHRPVVPAVGYDLETAVAA